MPLTKRQREILTYLQSYADDHGYAPSFEEIAAHFNYNSLATVHEHLSNLERKRYIKRSNERDFASFVVQLRADASRWRHHVQSERRQCRMVFRQEI